MEIRHKQRLVGAIVLIALAVIFLPEWLRPVTEPRTPAVELGIPPAPAHTYVPKTEPIPAPDPPAPSAAGPAEPTESEAPGDRLQGWVVQVGSFSLQTNAYRLRDQLREAGYAAFVQTIGLNDRILYRVKVGPELRKAVAEQQKEAIMAGFDIEGQVAKYP